MTVLIHSVLLVGIMTLTACASRSTDGASSQLLYSPVYLELVKGSTIQTPKGIYHNQVQSTWVNVETYRKLEKENLALSEALRKLQLKENLK